MTLSDYKKKLQDLIDRKQVDKAKAALKILNDNDIKITAVPSDEGERGERIFEYLRLQMINLGYVPRDAMAIVNEYADKFSEEPYENVIERIKQNPKYRR